MTLALAETWATPSACCPTAQTHAIAAISNNVIFVNLRTGVTTATLNTGVVGDIELSFDGQYAFVSNFNARIIDRCQSQIGGVGVMTVNPTPLNPELFALKLPLTKCDRWDRN